MDAILSHMFFLNTEVYPKLKKLKRAYDKMPEHEHLNLLPISYYATLYLESKRGTDWEEPWYDVHIKQNIRTIISEVFKETYKDWHVKKAENRVLNKKHKERVVKLAERGDLKGLNKYLEDEEENIGFVDKNLRFQFY